MCSSRLPRVPLSGAALVLALLSPARAGEPSARDLIALAPVLDSSNTGCRSLDIGGWFGGGRGHAPRLRFRALYQASNRFGLVVGDTEEGTPLVFCSGRRMFFYDPVGPAVYYSENACFAFELSRMISKVKFQIKYLLKNSDRSHILVDFRTLLSGDSRSELPKLFDDALVRRNMNEFSLIRSLDSKPYITLDVDLSRECPYTATSIVGDGAELRLDRIVLNGVLGEEPFMFPTKQQLLSQGLPIKEVSSDEDCRGLDINRACVVRAVVHTTRPQELISIPGIAQDDWDRVKENDKKFAKALRDLVPPALSWEGQMKKGQITRKK